MQLVHMLVHPPVVQPPMHKVDHAVREREEQQRRHGQIEVPVPRGVGVHPPVPELHGRFGGRGQRGHYRERADGDGDLAADFEGGEIVLGQKTGSEDSEVEEVVERGECEVDEEGARVEE